MKWSKERNQFEMGDISLSHSPSMAIIEAGAKVLASRDINVLRKEYAETSLRYAELLIEHERVLAKLAEHERWWTRLPRAIARWGKRR